MEKLAVYIKDRLAIDTAFAPDPVQFHDMGQGIATIVASGKGCFIHPDLYGRIDEVITIRLPQINLIFEKELVNLPESGAILPGHTLGREGRVNTGVAVVEHGPEDDPRLAALDKGFDNLGLGA